MAVMTARDIMTPDPVTVHDDMPVADLARLLSRHQISGAPVLNHKQALVGVVSVTDIVANEVTKGHTVVSESEFYARPDIGTLHELRRLGMHVEEYSDSLVRDIMTPVVVSAPVDATVEQLSEMMGVNRIHRLLITEADKLVGIVSALDLIGFVRPRASAGSGAPPRPRSEVIWATDLGVDAAEVGELAADLCRQIEARLLILHVTPDLGALWHDYGERPEVSDLQRGLEERAMERLSDLVKKLEREMPLEVMGKTGDPAGVILGIVEERRPRYLVLGSQRPEAERIHGLGSVAERILSSSPVPILTLPRR